MHTEGEEYCECAGFDEVVDPQELAEAVEARQNDVLQANGVTAHESEESCRSATSDDAFDAFEL